MTLPLARRRLARARLLAIPPARYTALTAAPQPTKALPR